MDNNLIVQALDRWTIKDIENWREKRAWIAQTEEERPEEVTADDRQSSDDTAVQILQDIAEQLGL